VDDLKAVPGLRPEDVKKGAVVVEFSGVRLRVLNPIACLKAKLHNIVRPGRDRLPVRLPTGGEPSRLAVAWAWALDARSDELVMLADDGIFRISVECV
jgi:hypothetical protein